MHNFKLFNNYLCKIIFIFKLIMIGNLITLKRNSIIISKVSNKNYCKEMLL